VLARPQAFPLRVVLDACEVLVEELACRIVVQRGVQVGGFQSWAVIERTTRPTRVVTKAAPPQFLSRRGSRGRAPRSRPSASRRTSAGARASPGSSSDDGGGDEPPPERGELAGPPIFEVLIPLEGLPRIRLWALREGDALRALAWLDGAPEIRALREEAARLAQEGQS
jgi:hypothetical protein